MPFEFAPPEQRRYLVNGRHVLYQEFRNFFLGGIARSDPATLAHDKDLEIFYASLHAPTIPYGPFDGKAWSHDLPFVQTIAPLFWQGKVFDEGTIVMNRIRGHLLIQGEVSLVDGAVVIDYPQLGLRDTLKQIDESNWLGRMQLGSSVVWFTLTAAS